jgi:hypothetical protein
VSFTAGDTFLITDPGFRKDHVRVVLVDPSGSPLTIITVQINSQTSISDKTTVINPGEHAFCRRPSVVSNDTLLEMEVDLLLQLERHEQGMRDPHFRRMEPFSTALLQRVIDGAFRSPMATPRMLRALRVRLGP